MNNNDLAKSVTSKQGQRRDGARADSGTLDPFYIAAPSPLADELSRVLKHGETFAVFDHYGDIKPAGLGEEGLYHEGTRFLSCLMLRLGQDRPLFLSSTIKEDNDLLAVDLTNPDIYVDGRLVIPRGTLHLARGKFLWEGVCYERLQIRNYGLAAIEISLSLCAQADFADIFEVRGTKRKSRGRLLPPILEAGAVLFTYEGLDGVLRRTRLEFTPQPTALSGGNGKQVLDGSAGHDVLIGGNSPDVLVGGVMDTLTGGNGPDIFLFRPDFGANTITDFDFLNDAIQLDKSIFASVADLLGHTTDTVNGAVISDTHGDTITLTHVTLAQLQAHPSDFYLV